jgi:spermidine synthase
MTSSSLPLEAAGADAQPAAATLDLFGGRPWLPVLIVFVSNVCIMVLELVAGRIIAPYVGVSLYTWTSVIGVVLAGMSLGNYLGGRLADRWASARLLGGVFLLAGLLSVGILAADTLGVQLPDSWPIVARILAFTAALFFLPGMVLGMVSPIVVKLAVRDLAKTGSTVGRISAAGTVGSIAGTFATGFVLISAFGTHVIVWGVAIALMAMAALFLLSDIRRGRVVAAALVLLILAGGTQAASAQGWIESRCRVETNYFCIKVYEEDKEGEPVRILILDRLVHSYSSLTNPKKLVYGYEQVYAEATAYQAQRHNPLKALFIGGGGYTFPRYMEAIYPGSILDVIEIDPGVTEIAYDLLGLARDSKIASYNEDARMFLKRPPAVKYDLVMGDAFNDYSVPYHLTTQEFNERVAAWLADDGLYMVNMIDGPRRDFLRAYVNTLGQTFTNVYVIPAVRSWQASPRVTFVVIASQRPLDLTALRSMDAGDGEAMLAEMLLDRAATEALLADGPRITLSDRYAPVDQMLAPVFRGEEARPDAPRNN